MYRCLGSNIRPSAGLVQWLQSLATMAPVSIGIYDTFGRSTIPAIIKAQQQYVELVVGSSSNSKHYSNCRQLLIRFHQTFHWFQLNCKLFLGLLLIFKKNSQTFVCLKIKGHCVS